MAIWFCSIGAIVIVIWTLSLSTHIGLRLAILTGICRSLWLLPIALALFPRLQEVELPHTLAAETIAVLLDDSDSMRNTGSLPSPLEIAQNSLSQLSSECRTLGCKLDITRLSELSDLTEQGFTPLSLILPDWLQQRADSPRLVLTDGMDIRSSQQWSKSMSNFRPMRSSAPKLVVGFQRPVQGNVWISSFTAPPFSFTGEPIRVDIGVSRTRATLSEELVQVQIISQDQVLSSRNVQFLAGEEDIRASILLHAIPKGKYILKAHILPSPDENVLWDNDRTVAIEVVNNTLGVLHLLGRPSWDGRFMRRYLKSEPKYDLVSFYILRDPWDEQVADERELSLIPFPVGKLFQEELINFRIIVLQNFNLFRFLLPQYQRNLVNFVKNGGGLLFIGGERALLEQDLQGSPLAELIPFELKKSVSKFSRFLRTRDEIDKDGPWFDPKQAFTVHMARPEAHRRSLASVFDSWAQFADIWPLLGDARGLHHTENVTLRREVTPLLTAKTAEGASMPLAVASYPGKGRAIWLFTDQIWKLAVSPKKQLARSLYNDFWDSSLLWLTRNDFRRPLASSDFKLQSLASDHSSWSMFLHGEAVRFLDARQNWQLSICNQNIAMTSVNIESMGRMHARLSGSIALGNAKTIESCPVRVHAAHPAFGSVTEAFVSFIPATMNDQALGFARHKVEDLARFIEADFIGYVSGAQLQNTLTSWLDKANRGDGLLLPRRFRIEKEHYWAFATSWFWLLILFLPLEVVVRRWRKLSPASN